MHTRETIVKKMQEWVGAKQGDPTHKLIIDTYNSHKPLARGYAVKYTDAWCAATISAAAIACGDDDIIPLECSCSKMIEKAMQMGIWQENDSYTPKPGDIVLYDWNDTGVGDNKGNPDHVGMAESVSGGIIIVIEGNKDKKVGKRSLLINGRYIRGFILPKYTQKVAQVKIQTKQGTTDEETIWNYLMGNLGNAYAAAGLMGNLFAESGLKSNNMQNSYEKKLGMNDDQYVAAVDAGTYTNFVRDSVGFGLAQWTYWSRKQALLEYAKKTGRSIGNLQMQLEYLIKEIQGYKAVYNTLKNAKTVREASDIVLTKYEMPSDQSEAMKEKRAGYGQNYLQKYSGQAQEQTKRIRKLAAAQSKDAKKRGKYKTTADLNLRFGPDKNKYDSIKVLPKGSVVNCYGYYTNEWLYVADQTGQAGFTHSGYLEKVGE